MTMKLAVDNMVLNIHILSKKKVIRDCPAYWSKTGTRQRLNWQLNTMQGQVEMYQSTLTVQQTMLDIGLCSKWPTYVPLLTKHHRQLYTCNRYENVETGRWINESELPGQMRHGLSFITPMVVSGYTFFQANSCSLNVQQVIHRPVVAVLRFGGRSPVRLWGTLVMVEQTLNVTEYLNIILDQLRLYMTSVFRTGNGTF